MLAVLSVQGHLARVPVEPPESLLLKPFDQLCHIPQGADRQLRAWASLQRPVFWHLSLEFSTETGLVSYPARHSPGFLAETLLNSCSTSSPKTTAVFPSSLFFRGAFREFPRGPVIRTPHSHCRGPCFDPW